MSDRDWQIIMVLYFIIMGMAIIIRRDESARFNSESQRILFGYPMSSRSFAIAKGVYIVAGVVAMFAGIGFLVALVVR